MLSVCKHPVHNLNTSQGVQGVEKVLLSFATGYVFPRQPVSETS